VEFGVFGGTLGHHDKQVLGAAWSKTAGIVLELAAHREIPSSLGFGNTVQGITLYLEVSEAALGGRALKMDALSLPAGTRRKQIPNELTEERSAAGQGPAEAERNVILLVAQEFEDALQLVLTQEQIDRHRGSIIVYVALATLCPQPREATPALLPDPERDVKCVRDAGRRN
jgi:hypothetical protein